MHSTAQQYVV
jgi:hypothetical protein